MAILSNLFADDSSNDTGDSSNLLGALDAVVSIDASNTSYSQSVDDDGSSDTSYNQSEFGTDIDVGSILSNMSDSFSSSDSDGGLFG